MDEDNTNIHRISHNGQQIAEINIETDEIFDPIMYSSLSIKDYIEDVIDGGNIDEITDPTIIIAILNEDGSKRFGLSTWSRFKFPKLSDEKYNTDKFEKLYFKCNSNVGWEHASNQANLDLGLLMSLRIQFPPMSEGFIRWGDLHNYLMYSNSVKEYSKDGQTHEYYIIPVKQHQSLPGVVSYGFYIHQKVFERKPSYIEHAKHLGLYDQEWNVSASHCQAENNYLYAPISNDDIIMTDSEIFPVLSDDFTSGVNLARHHPQDLLTPIEAEDILDALNSDDDDDMVQPVRNLFNDFNEADDDDDISQEDDDDDNISQEADDDIINIYQNDNSEMVDAVNQYVEDREERWLKGWRPFQKNNEEITRCCNWACRNRKSSYKRVN